jgi:hypothetical protein
MEKQTNANHPNTGPLHHYAEDDNSIEAIKERMNLIYGDQRTTLDELVELYRNEEQHEQFEEALEDLAHKALQENDEFVKNARIMRSRTVSPEIQKQIRDRQHQLLDSYKQAIVREAGLSTEASQTEIEAAKQHVKEIVEAQVEKAGAVDALDILSTLGILRKDKDGNETFFYPSKLFPKDTNDKWTTYIETVRNHLKIGGLVKLKQAAPEELGEADKVRRIAHNAVSRDVDEILGFENLPDTRWDLEKTRELLAKMRDTRFPNVQSGEKFVTEKAVVEGVIGAHALKALTTRLSDLTK